MTLEIYIEVYCNTQYKKTIHYYKSFSLIFLHIDLTIKIMRAHIFHGHFSLREGQISYIKCSEGAIHNYKNNLKLCNQDSIAVLSLFLFFFHLKPLWTNSNNALYCNLIRILFHYRPEPLYCEAIKSISLLCGKCKFDYLMLMKVCWQRKWICW